MKCTVLHQHGGNRTSAFVESCLDDSTLGGTVGIRFQFHDVGHQNDAFEQVVKTFVSLGGNGNAHDVAAPFFGNEIILGELLLDLFGVRADLINLIDGDDDLYIGGLCMVDGFDGLRHNAVVGSDN